MDAHRCAGDHFWATDAVQKFRQFCEIYGFAGIQQNAPGLQMIDGQCQFAGRQWPVEHLYRAIGAADQPRGEP
ncbi:hypothetical protein D3C76_1610010 [compost metagenome]